MDYAAAPLGEDLRARYRALGLHTDLTLPRMMQRNVAEMGGLTAVVEGGRSVTWSDLLTAAGRLAAFLSSQGVGPGDSVVWQLPNWWEALVVAYGVWGAGAVSAPVVPIYREHELGAVLRAVEPRCVITARSFRGVDHVDLMESAVSAWGGSVPVRVVVRGAAPGWVALEEALAPAPAIVPAVDPDAPALVGFTSGTTSGSKAVVMSTRSLLAVPLRHVRATPFTWRDRGYMPAPVSHATGLLTAVTIPLLSGCSVVLADRWDAARAVEDIRAHGVTYSAGASVFMQELADAVEAAGLSGLPLSCGYACGGSPIPTELARRCDALGMKPRRAYGMTECPTVSASTEYDDPAVRLAADGRVVPGCDVRVVSPEGVDLSPGQIGEFVVRGPQRALGYVDPDHTAEAFDAEGWFRSGDLGTVDADGVLTVTGRVKEIINRGGEKLSAREIEDLISRHPAVADVAVVAAPHPRLGEEPAAFVVGRPGSAVSGDDIAAFLRSEGVAPQKIPRVWVPAEDLPRTPSGKVKKYELVDRLPGR